MKINFDNYILDLKEPNRSCIMALRDIILSQNKNISWSWKYKMPFFCYKSKMLCYLWIDKKNNEPYIGFVDGNLMDSEHLEKGNRKQIKILRVNPIDDFDMKLIEDLLNEAIQIKKQKI